MVVPIKFNERHEKDKNISFRSHHHRVSSRYNVIDDQCEIVDLEEANPSTFGRTRSNSVAALDAADGHTISSANLRISTKTENQNESNSGRDNVQINFTKDSVCKYILLPHSQARTYWDVYTGILLIYVGTFLPYRVSFLGDLDGIMEGVEIFVDASFLIDIILNFMTGTFAVEDSAYC